MCRCMSKIKDILKGKDVGSIGIGAMIVFIAMVLVAGIAASVLIQTSTRLEAQAMASGSETVEEVASGIAIFDIVGSIVTANEDIRYLAITVRARAGSPNIDLNHTAILISDETDKCLLRYDYADEGHFEDEVNGDLFATDTWDDLTDEEFGILVIEDADDSLSQFAPVINKGDKVVLSIQCGDATGAFAAYVPERTDIFGKIVPEVGFPGMITFTTPAAYNEIIMDLQ